ncbi:hypothetical protein TSUD_299740 [Trifolium subterraneum]|uniref:Reverse transcriptase domain-containing protein n=1 Tax=Trifolium subterraneum TaxID=3900 RepID=A0A2Z6NAR9_TRISU|nr:hypothetical protein TSUD_299740 [Trifolium subterraneum]
MHCSNQLQQSRLIWLKDGDANSKFFHGLRPNIANLQFKSISEADAYYLERPFAEDEVKQAVWECDSLKSPGPDGINFGFIKEFWMDVKNDFMRFLLEFYSNNRLVKGSNCTFIVFIPKVANPKKMSDFRHISLVGCMYKVLANVLANRLKSVIDKVILDTQSTFVKGRQILDGILIANEAVDDAKKRKKELLLFKVDFEKAYDSVDWKYLESVMGKMGFSDKWRRWIMTCVSSATASGYQVGSEATSSVHLSHLQFADDTLIMGQFPKKFVGEGEFSDSWLADAARVLNSFLWGGSEESRKINWLKWDRICLRKEEGGLGVRRVKEFNLALLGKWCWRLLQDTEGLWFRVLAAKYGIRDGQMDCGGSTASNWWKVINSIRSGSEASGGRWFGENTVRRVGDGERTLFWKDSWMDRIPFKVHFSRIFELCLDKDRSVANMCRLGWGFHGDGWRWHRRLFAWEEELWGECCAALANVSLQVDLRDEWEWLTDPVAGYSVSGAYQILTHLTPIESYSHLENAHHLFLNCPVFGAVWDNIISWLGVPCVLPANALALASQFCGAHAFCKSTRSCFQAIWLANVWFIWKERNSRVFNHKEMSTERLVYNIKTNVGGG